MEKSQYELCIEVLRRLEKTGVLKHLVIIGSWCIPFYKEYFTNVRYIPSIRTRDIDFLVPKPRSIEVKVDLPEILKDLGFIIGFKGSKGFIRLENPDLIIEFLVPERGRGTDKPHPLPQLGLNAQTLRFLGFLTDNVIHVKVEGLSLTLPHPANFALHKLIVSQRRKIDEKMIKDSEAGLNILKALVDKGENSLIKQVYKTIPQSWRKKIKTVLRDLKEPSLLELLEYFD